MSPSMRLLTTGMAAAAALATLNGPAVHAATGGTAAGPKWATLVSSEVDSGDPGPLVDERGTLLAATPDGKHLVAAGTGYDHGSNISGHYEVSGFDAATGKRTWTTTYAGPHGEDIVTGVVAAPTGNVVYVTGYSFLTYYDANYVTIAVNALTGEKLWTASYDGIGGIDKPTGDAVSPDGSVVYVTGDTQTDLQVYSEAGETVAYDASSGRELWRRMFSQPYQYASLPTALAATPSGVFVTGWTHDSYSGNGLMFVAGYSTTGTDLWSAGSAPADGWGQYGPGNRIVYDAKTRMLYVVGAANTGTKVVGYRAATGRIDWTSQFAGNNFYAGPDAVVSSDGAHLYIVVPDGSDRHVVALRAGTGGVEWTTTLFADRATPEPGIAVTPDGSTVYVVGENLSHVVTTALSSRDGSTLWSSSHATAHTADDRYGLDSARSLIANPATGDAVVGGDAEVGDSRSNFPDYDMLLLDYSESAASPSAAPVAVTGPASVQGIPSQPVTFDVALHSPNLTRIGRLSARTTGADSTVSVGRTAVAASPGSATDVAVTVNVGSTQVSGFDVVVTACDPDYSLSDCSTTTVHVIGLV